MHAISDYDARQYELMKNFIDTYEQGKLGLGNLISKLEGLLAVLEDVSPDWAREFFRHWGILEEVYSVARVDQVNLNEKDHMLIASALTELKNLMP